MTSKEEQAKADQAKAEQARKDQEKKKAEERRVTPESNFPHAKPGDRYGDTHPEGFKPATRPTVADPNAVSPNVRQHEEVKRREEEEWAQRHPEDVGGVRDAQFQQPGAPSQQYEKYLEQTTPVVSEKTKEEIEAGRKAVESAPNRSREEFDREQEELKKREQEQAANAIGDTGEQLAVKKREAERQQEEWGTPPKDVNRNTIAGVEDKK